MNGRGSKKRNAVPRSAAGRALSANMEDYLEAIFQLSERDGTARVSHIADTLGVKRPSVSKAIKRLQAQGLIRHRLYGGVGMTARGRKLANQQVQAHRVLTRFLTGVLHLPEALSEHDACLIEHAISHETVERLVQFIEHLSKNGKARTFRKAVPVIQSARNADRSWVSRV